MKGAIGISAGVCGGFLGGLVGVGGGVVMIPIMTWLAHLTQHKAHGTSLLAIVFTALVGAATYFFHDAVDLRVALMIAGSAIVTARRGALYAHSLPERKLKKAFGWFILLVSMILLAKEFFPKSTYEVNFWAGAAIFLATGAATGFVSGMMGVGGGTIMVPAMVILAGMQQHTAQGTSLLAMVPVSVSGALTHYKLGNVQMDIGWGLATGALVGGYFGAATANLLPELYLKIVFAVVMIWMGVKYIRTR